VKQLILIRHAKSDWANAGLDDFDRPLNDRGKRDAPLMVQRLIDKKVKIDAFISSPAKRAAKTAKIFVDGYGRDKDDLLFKEELYLAAPATFFSVIEKIDDAYNSVAIFSHNNGLTDFANLLTDARIDNIPTCGIFAVTIDSDSWSDFRTAKKEFWFFDYPKA
jgi:phosphohistidine phosphatase